MKLILIFIRTIKKKIKVVRNGREYISFRIDVYFSEYIHKLHIDEMKGHPIFEKKRQEALEKIFDFKFIRTNPSKENYDIFFETGRTQTSISELKKKIRRRNKRFKRKNKLLKTKL